MPNYLQKAKALQTQANTILQDLDLIKLLAKYGNIEIVGSYALELMSWEDIDLLVIGKPSYKNYLDVVNYLFARENVYSMNLQDFRKSIYPDRPKGIYCGISYLMKPDTFWKIDIWFLLDSTSIDVVNEVKKKLNNDNRSIILNIKNEMRDKTEHGREVSGMDVYKAVLDEEITDLEGFREYLKKQGRDL